MIARMCAREQEGDEAEITPEMIEAGRTELGFADLEDLPERIVVAIYTAMARVRASQRQGIVRKPTCEGH